MEMLGFVGQMTTDETLTVSESIKKALILVKEHVFSAKVPVSEIAKEIVIEIEMLPQFKERKKSFFFKTIS
jgi:hypothetical protein